jgi:hypothetical protein
VSASAWERLILLFAGEQNLGGAELRGQWIGRYEGSTGGEIILNVDELEEGYLSIAYLLPDDKSLPRVAASFKTPNKNSPFSEASVDRASVPPNTKP